MSLPTIGISAPPFSLRNQQDEFVSLDDLKGKIVVLYFYPKAMTPGCTVQACSLRDSKTELDRLGIVVLGVSPDPVKKLQKFIEKEALNFTLLSDEESKAKLEQTRTTWCQYSGCMAFLPVQFS
jgi:peroxiredoxin Q/BCP